MISQEEIFQLKNLRNKVFNQIEICLAEDSHCKNYEGQFSIVIPSYFEDQDDCFDKWALNLDLYAFGPNRHYSWEGKDLSECIFKAEEDIDNWIKGYNS